MADVEDWCSIEPHESPKTKIILAFFRRTQDYFTMFILILQHSHEGYTIEIFI